METDEMPQFENIENRLGSIVELTTKHNIQLRYCVKTLIGYDDIVGPDGGNDAIGAVPETMVDKIQNKMQLILDNMYEIERSVNVLEGSLPRIDENTREAVNDGF